MRKELLLALALCAGSIGSAYGVATNYDLTLAGDARVTCDRLTKLDGAQNYTIQLWFNPTVWTEGATLLSAADSWSVSLGKEGTIVAKVGNNTAEIKSGNMAHGKWAQLTIVTDGDKTTVLVNGNTTDANSLGAMPAKCGEFTIGGRYEGRIDEVRIWNTALNDEFNYFIKNTLNRWCPEREALVAYYKFDHKDCPNIVEQTAIWEENTTEANNHGVITGTASLNASDNTAMKYRVNGAYTANERFYDRAIPKNQYLLSNDLIILGIESHNDGHLNYATPNNHATANGEVKTLAEFEGHKGVVSFDGNSWLDCGTETLNVSNNIYTAETWFYIDEWTEGAIIFAKETADGKNGISMRLGNPDNKSIDVIVDGNRYRVINAIEAKKWHHIAIWPSGSPSDVRYNFTFIIDGELKPARKSESSQELVQVPTGNSGEKMILGKGFKGKLDETAFWLYNAFNADNIKSHMNKGLWMPGFDVIQTAGIMMKAHAAYLYDKADRIGYDSYSQDHWRDIMLTAYEGMEGYEVRISVKSHSGWENTIADAAKRKIFAADLAKLSEGYDGVELDLEWLYGPQTTLGLLAEEIRNALPEGKSFNISCHNVAYSFPKDKMQYVDGFTFQQYGPQNEHSRYSHFVDMCDAFVKYGFEPSKIITSYATTTSKGYQDGTPKVDIKGVRNDFFDEDYVPDEELDSKEINGYTYYYDGPLQTYKRARHTVDNDFGGIFYWDMGNDVPFDHKYNMAKWCAYGLNSNVEPRVTEVPVIRTTGIEDIACNKRGEISIKVEGDCVSAAGASSITVYTLSGIAVVAANDGKADISSLAPGIYIAKAISTDGSHSTLKLTK